jgi:hypothetical protein
MSTRLAYFDDLVRDCWQAVNDVGIPEIYKGQVMAALIQSDSLNGLRKALLQAEANRRTAP